jgi:hypothetical protein
MTMTDSTHDVAGAYDSRTLMVAAQHDLANQLRREVEQENERRRAERRAQAQRGSLSPTGLFLLAR